MERNSLVKGVAKALEVQPEMVTLALEVRATGIPELIEAVESGLMPLVAAHAVCQDAPEEQLKAIQDFNRSKDKP